MERKISEEKMQGITAWELVIERRFCSFSCSAALFCSLETILCALSLSPLMILLLAFFPSGAFLFAINSAEFCGHLKEGMSSQIHMISCVFFQHDCLSLFINKYYIHFGWTYKSTLLYILESFHLPNFKMLLSLCQVLTYWLLMWCS